MNIESQSSLERALAAQLRKLLGAVSWLKDWKVSLNPAPHNRIYDISATICLPKGNTALLWVECRDLPRPSQFPYVCLENTFHEGGRRLTRIPVLAAPLITDRMAELCDKHGWGWYDLAGNCQLSVPGGFFIERRGNDPVHHRKKPTANLGTVESGRVIRALLVPQNAGRRWTQRDLQKHCEPGVSIGLVNKVVFFLREEAYVMDHAEGGFRLHDPMGLLTAWREAYRFDRHERRGYFTLKQGRALREALATLGPITGNHAAYAAFSAAEFQAPNVRQQKTWLWIGAAHEEDLAKALEAKPVDSGENLVVLVAEDSGVFYQQEAEAGQLARTNAVQTYVDLSHAGGRGTEAADALLEQNLMPAWRKGGVTS